MSGHYFDRVPTSQSSRRRVKLVLPDLTIELATDRGIFSHERVDPGTKYLLRDAPHPPPEARHLLDLGCGYGPIAVALARRSPNAVVWAVDINERAVGICAENAVTLGLDNLHARPVGEDGRVADLSNDVRFDAIYSNPSIRIGKQALHQMLADWLARLTDTGHMYLVVQKHLGSDSLQQWLIANGYPTSRLASSAGYRILDITTAAP